MPIQRPQLKVKRIRVYNGVTLNQQVLSGIDAEKHKVGMEVHQFGIVVTQHAPFSPKLIPWANILECDLLEDEPLSPLRAVAQ